MSIETLKQELPAYAKDLKLNLGNVLSSPNLTPVQIWGTALASALASRNKTVIQAIGAEARQHLDENTFAAAQAAHAIMAMNNIYYRFVHLASNKEYGTMPANLRMNIMMNPGADKADFELWSLAVSAVNGCGMCIDSHEQTLKKHGVGKDMIQNAIRIASTIHAVAAVLDGEENLNNQPAQIAA